MGRNRLQVIRVDRRELAIGLGLVLSFSYILFMTVTSSFAVSGLTSPMVAMWIPNFIYTIIAVVLYFKAAR